MTPMTLDEFVDGLLSKDRTLDDIELEVKLQLKADYVQHLNGEIMRALLSALPELKLIEFENLVDTSSDVQLVGWLEQHVPDAREVITGVLVKFANELQPDPAPKPWRRVLRWLRSLWVRARAGRSDAAR